MSLALCALPHVQTASPLPCARGSHTICCRRYGGSVCPRSQYNLETLHKPADVPTDSFYRHASAHTPLMSSPRSNASKTFHPLTPRDLISYETMSHPFSSRCGSAWKIALHPFKALFTFCTLRLFEKNIMADSTRNLIPSTPTSPSGTIEATSHPPGSFFSSQKKKSRTKKLLFPSKQCCHSSRPPSAAPSSQPHHTTGQVMAPNLLASLLFTPALQPPLSPLLLSLKAAPPSLWPPPSFLNFYPMACGGGAMPSMGPTKRQYPALNAA